MSHSAFAEFPCNPGRGPAFLADAMMPALEDTRAFDGCESIEVYVDEDDPDLVILWEKWASRPQYEAYISWRMATGFVEMVAPYMDPSRFRAVHLNRQG